MRESADSCYDMHVDFLLVLCEEYPRIVQFPLHLSMASVTDGSVKAWLFTAEFPRPYR